MKTLTNRSALPAPLLLGFLGLTTGLLHGESSKSGEGKQGRFDVIAARIPSRETDLESDHLTGDWGGLRQRAVDNGVHFHAGYTGEFFSNLDGGIETGTEFMGLFEMSLDVDPSAFSRWQGAAWHVSALSPHGGALTGNRVGDLSTVSNIEEFETISLFELWLDQRFLGDRVSLRLGQLAADEEFAMTEHGSLFINATFGWPFYVSANATGPAYPLAAPGARIEVDPVDGLRFRAAIYDGDPDPGDSEGNRVNKYGTRINVNSDEGYLTMYEAEGILKPFGAEASKPGHYKLGAWYHTGDFDHQLEDENGLSLGNPLSSGMPRQLNGNWGAYLIIDQALWNEPAAGDTGEAGADAAAASQGLGGFLRLSGSPEERSFNAFYVDGGLTYRGLFPGRDEDNAGVAVAYLEISEDARQLSGDLGMTSLDYEIAIEATYEFVLTPWWSIQPDVQYIIHPGGSSELDNAFVVGMRTSIVF